VFESLFCPARGARNGAARFLWRLGGKGMRLTTRIVPKNNSYRQIVIFVPIPDAEHTLVASRAPRCLGEFGDARAA